MIRNRYVLFGFRLITGGVFIWAGITKIMDPLGFAQSIADYRVFPRWIAFFLALVLPWVEVICGGLLISGLFLQASALLSSALLAGFLVLIGITMGRGLHIDCGCFGSLSHEVDAQLILTDAFLLFLCLNLFFHKDSS